MANKYLKLDSVLGLIERVKAGYKENPAEHPINYGTMVGMEVAFNTDQLFTEQDIIKPYLEKLKAEIGKSKTEHEMQIAERDIKAKMLISHIYCGIVNILDKCMNDKCDKGCDFCEHTSECMPSKEEEEGME